MSKRESEKLGTNLCSVHALEKTLTQNGVPQLQDL